MVARQLLLLQLSHASSSEEGGKTVQLHLSPFIKKANISPGPPPMPNGLPLGSHWPKWAPWPFLAAKEAGKAEKTVMNSSTNHHAALGAGGKLCWTHLGFCEQRWGRGTTNDMWSLHPPVSTDPEAGALEGHRPHSICSPLTGLLGSYSLRWV